MLLYHLLTACQVALVVRPHFHQKSVATALLIYIILVREAHLNPSTESFESRQNQSQTRP